MAKDWRKLEYYVPINEVMKGKDTFLIRGVAINETTTRNGVRYKADELMKAAPSLRNKPILKDHNNSVDNIVGRTTQNVYFNESTKRIEFEGDIKDPIMREKIDQGLISSVSVGAMVQNLCEEEVDGEGKCLVANGIDFVEISLVAVPADPNAGFARAIAESFDLKKLEEAVMLKCESCDSEFKTQEELDKHVIDKHPKVTEEESVTDDKKTVGGNKMAEEQTEALKIQLEEKTRILEEQTAQLNKKLAEYQEKEMNALRESYKALATEKNVTVKEGYDKLSKEVLEVLIETLKSIKVIETKADNTKGEVKTETKDEKVDSSNMIVEKSNHGYSLYSEDLGKLNSKYNWRE